MVFTRCGEAFFKLLLNRRSKEVGRGAKDDKICQTTDQNTDFFCFTVCFLAQLTQLGDAFVAKQSARDP
jgi:hypothetical protein